MTDLAGRRGQPVAHLEGGLPGEGAEHDVLRLGPTQQQEVQGPQDDAEGLAGPRTRDHQQRPVEMADDRALALGELRVVLRDGGRDVHHGPPLRGRFACGPGVSPADARVLPGRAVPRGRAVPWRMDSWFPESAGTQTQEGPSSAPATHESVRVDIGVLGKASCCPGFVADVKRASCSVSYVEVEAVGQVERELAAPPLREVPPAVTRPSAEIQLSGVPPDHLLPVVILEAADDLLNGIESVSAPAYLHCPASHVDHRPRGRECCFGEQQWRVDRGKYPDSPAIFELKCGADFSLKHLGSVTARQLTRDPDHAIGPANHSFELRTLVISVVGKDQMHTVGVRFVGTVHHALPDTSKIRLPLVPGGNDLNLPSMTRRFLPSPRVEPTRNTRDEREGRHDQLSGRSASNASTARNGILRSRISSTVRCGIRRVIAR